MGCKERGWCACTVSQRYAYSKHLSVRCVYLIKYIPLKFSTTWCLALGWASNIYFLTTWNTSHFLGSCWWHWMYVAFSFEIRFGNQIEDIFDVYIWYGTLSCMCMIVVVTEKIHDLTQIHALKFEWMLDNLLEKFETLFLFCLLETGLLWNFIFATFDDKIQTMICILGFTIRTWSTKRRNWCMFISVYLFVPLNREKSMQNNAFSSYFNHFICNMSSQTHSKPHQCQIETNVNTWMLCCTNRGPFLLLSPRGPILSNG